MTVCDDSIRFVPKARERLPVCTMVYLASDRPLPTKAWDKDHPAFYSEFLDSIHGADKIRVVRSRFSKPFVFRLGSNQGCGCGFAYQEWTYEGDYDPAELDAAKKSRESLAAYLETALSDQESLEIWICWAGDEHCETEDRHTVCPEDFLDPGLYASEKILFTVKSTPI